MRNLIFGIMLGVVAAAGLYTAISASVAANRPATFAERFAPALKSGG
jgi:hypothetical protein